MTLFSVQLDQTFLDESLPQLQEYLLSGELYWAISCGVPRLTPGNILLALTRLSAAEPAEARELREKMDLIRRQWAVAWEQKVARETDNRLRLWSQFLGESGADSGPGRAVYAANVQGRVILGLLLREVPNSARQTALAELDVLLRAGFVPGDFIWEGLYQPIFPAQEYWYLYGCFQPGNSTG
jgi:hypothetical protein